jgi:aspartyl aminopeptidase
VTTPLVQDLLGFLRSSPTPYHAVDAATSRLATLGFRALDAREPWSDLGPGRYWVTAGDASVVAFVIPTSRAVKGFRIIGAHTDSPNLRLKPNPSYVKEGYAQLGVEVYGGALVNSWLDRDLSLAGRVIVREGAELKTKLVRIDRPLCRIAQLAIHLDRDVGERGLQLNKQEHLAPILGLAGADAPDVAALCAKELGVPEIAIAGLDLMLYDVVPPTLAGAQNELLFSARLDNQAMCHAALRALMEVTGRAADGEIIPVIALFDHEEIGSNSAQGAASAFLPRVLERIALAGGRAQDDVHRLLSGSLCVSADMAHAVHPNYADRHEPRHKPTLNGGPVIKTNAQQRYATSAATAALFADLCRQADVPVQHYAHRTDLPCGSTIGPITATLLGIPTVDVGNPMLSMHSVRELCGAKDPDMMVRVLARFLAHGA